MKISCVLGCENSQKHKNIRNKPKATEAHSNAPGMETALLDFIQMSCNEIISYILHRHHFSCLDSQKKSVAGKTPH